MLILSPFANCFYDVKIIEKQGFLCFYMFREQNKARTAAKMLLATARGIMAGNERKTAARLESQHEKLQTGEREKGQPLIRPKAGFCQQSRPNRLLYAKCIIPV
jgi:hypothetical protein